VPPRRSADPDGVIGGISKVTSSPGDNWSVGRRETSGHRILIGVERVAADEGVTPRLVAGDVRKSTDIDGTGRAGRRPYRLDLAAYRLVVPTASLGTRLTNVSRAR
jgi:hypothetical protein